jgi:hypothetical protein
MRFKSEFEKKKRSYILRTLKHNREQQFQNRECFQFHPSKEERREEKHSGCSALTERRRRLAS